MARQSEVDIALASIDQQIEQLNRAKDIIIASRIQAKHGDAPAKRPRKRKAGLPAQSTGE